MIKLGGVKTLTPPSRPPILDHPYRPEWIDAVAVRAIFTLSRATLYRLAEAGKIRTTSLRERGKLKGRRLFSYDSIRQFLESRATGGEGVQPEAAPVGARQ